MIQKLAATFSNDARRAGPPVWECHMMYDWADDNDEG